MKEVKNKVVLKRYKEIEKCKRDLDPILHSIGVLIRNNKIVKKNGKPLPAKTKKETKNGDING
jgi:hypothetical protein